MYMSLTPASAQRRLAYDIIHDYIVKILDKSTPLYRRQALAETIPTITLALLQRLRRDRVREVVRRILPVFSQIFKLDVPEVDRNMNVEEWYLACLGERSSSEEWLLRVALCSLAVLSYACVEEAEIVEAVAGETVD